MHDWPHRVSKLREDGTPFVIVTVAGIRGSAPRETGSKMLVTADGVQGTIGGGQLEHACIAAARKRLRASDTPARSLRRFALGSECGQCCGGVVDVLFEDSDSATSWIDAAFAAFRAGARAALVTVTEGGETRVISAAAIAAMSSVRGTTDPAFTDPAAQRALRAAVAAPGTASFVRARLPDGETHSLLVEPIGPPPLTVVLFGAGHVGRAVATVLGTLDAAVFVVDSRPEQLQSDWPDNVTPAYIANPADFVAHCPPQSCYLVMTHDHGLDLDLCREILARPDRRYCGLIGSVSKRRRFEKRLRAAGYDEATLESMTCPIGSGGITGKHPGEIAVAVANQLITLDETAAGATDAASTDNVAMFPGAGPGTRGNT